MEISFAFCFKTPLPLLTVENGNECKSIVAFLQDAVFLWYNRNREVPFGLGCLSLMCVVLGGRVLGRVP